MFKFAYLRSRPKVFWLQLTVLMQVAVLIFFIVCLGSVAKDFYAFFPSRPEQYTVGEFLQSVTTAVFYTLVEHKRLSLLLIAWWWLAQQKKILKLKPAD